MIELNNCLDPCVRMESNPFKVQEKRKELFAIRDWMIRDETVRDLATLDLSKHDNLDNYAMQIKRYNNRLIIWVRFSRIGWMYVSYFRPGLEARYKAVGERRRIVSNISANIQLGLLRGTFIKLSHMLWTYALDDASLQRVLTRTCETGFNALQFGQLSRIV